MYVRQEGICRGLRAVALLEWDGAFGLREQDTARFPSDVKVERCGANGSVLQEGIELALPGEGRPESGLRAPPQWRAWRQGRVLETGHPTFRVR
jgi:hypothetical protein